MFEAVDLNRDPFVDQFSTTGSRTDGKSTPTRTANRLSGDAVRTVLLAGFRSRVMSWHTAHEWGARVGLSLIDLKVRTELCAGLIDSGLQNVIDEPLFAALVFHYPDLAKDIARSAK